MLNYAKYLKLIKRYGPISALPIFAFGFIYSDYLFTRKGRELHSPREFGKWISFWFASLIYVSSS